jgi:hypothetical protein
MRTHLNVITMNANKSLLSHRILRNIWKEIIEKKVKNFFLFLFLFCFNSDQKLVKLIFDSLDSKINDE